MANITIKHITYQSPESEKEQVINMQDGLYHWAIKSRLTKPWDKEIFGFAAAFDGDKVVGTTSYTITPRGQAILSDVFTDEKYRGQGIAKSVLNETIETYKRYGARAVYLAAWDEWIRNIYRKYGFVNVGNMGKRGAFKLTLRESGEDKVLFRPGQKTVLRPMQIGDQADITSLFCTDHGSLVVKNYELGCYLGSYFEAEFFVLQNQVTEGIVPEERVPKKGYRSIVLDGEETILGLGTLIPGGRRHEAHAGILDILIHPDYRNHSQAMLNKLEENMELDHVYVYLEENEDFKIELFEKNGYEKLARLENHIKIGDESFNILLFTKKFR